VLRKKFGFESEELTAGWIKLPVEESSEVYSSANIVKVIIEKQISQAGHVVGMGEKRNACRVFMGKPEGKRPLGRPRRRWKDVNKDI
jgi:hypothetical protein